MEYTIQEMSRISKVSKRALRYYDEIGLLHPLRMNSSGYRIYGENEIDRLQQILFLKEMNLSLEEIKDILNQPYYDEIKLLENHMHKLIEEKKRIEQLITNIEKTIREKQGGQKMTINEKFEGFKESLIQDNEKYKEEVTSKYGENTYKDSIKKIKGMSEENYKKSVTINEQMMECLKQAFLKNDFTCEDAQKAVELHKEWLSIFYPKYTKEYHLGLADMYVEDERFAQNYEVIGKDGAVFFRNAIVHYFKNH